MFRAERKAKRLSKIKSKTYRRLAKKARLRAAEANGEAGEMSLDQMEELDAIDGGSRAREELERLEIQRARERATLKHASKGGGGGRWSRSMAGMHGMDADVGEAMADRASREEELRRRIAGREKDDDSSSGDDSDVDDDMDGMDDDEIRLDAFDEVAAMREKDRVETAKSKPTGLMAMKFMQRAADEDQKRVDREVDDFERELGGVADEEGGEAASLGQRVQGNAGRMVFAPTKVIGYLESLCTLFTGSLTYYTFQASGVAAATSEAVEQRPSQGSQEQTVRLSGPLSVKPTSAPSAEAETASFNPFAKLSSMRPAQDDDTPGTEETGANPWLAIGDPSASLKISRKNDGAEASSSSNRDVLASKAAAKASKQLSKGADARKAAKEDAEVVVDLDNVLGGGGGEKKRRKPRSKKKGGALDAAAAGAKEREAKAAEESSDEEAGDEPVRVPVAFNQRDLVARAFANDNVVAVSICPLPIACGELSNSKRQLFVR
jgi:U3 small nucleolar RNA-associated protein 14